jgi:nucleoside-diphosphate-sugar epimerase
VSGAPGDATLAPDATSSSTPQVAVVTGATGFIGRHTCAALQRRGWQVRGVVRSRARAGELPPGVEPVAWDLEREEAPDALVCGARAVVHLAGRAHRMGADAGEAAAYRRLNVDATRALLACSRAAGVRRFVYVSSIKVLGEGEASPYAATAPLDPRDPYARSKAEAEAIVQTESGAMEWTIVRPAFVYGPGGKGNFPRLLRLAHLASRLPLPLGAIRNRRSMIYVENLADLLAFCAADERVAGRVMPGVDGDSVSTPQLLQAICEAQGHRARLVPVPPLLLSAAARALGRGSEWRRLAGSFEVDAGVLREIGWQPPVTFGESLQRSVARGLAA